MSTYLDVAVVRIQSWLTRAPHLRGRRGASTMIRRATDPEAITALLSRWQDVVQRCEEAGHIDGVVPLRLHTDDPATVRCVEQHIVRHLRAHLPAAPVRTSYWRGSSWLDAHDVDSPDEEHDWPPAVAEWPPAKQCDWCRTWPASVKRVVGANEDRQEKALCTDCLAREKCAGYATSSTEALAPGTERDLLERWEKRWPQRPATVPDNSGELAKLGEQHDNTHLATIYADGNAIGQFGKQLRAAQRTSRGRGFELPAAIEHATWEALLEAIESTTDNEATVLPITAHFVGGDDVLISIPAHRAWTFARTMQEKFTRVLADSLEESGLGKITAPTVSTAVVFHHHASPLATAVDLADELLQNAKKEHRGRAAALAWQDITHDGPQPLSRPSLRLDALTEAWTDLHALAELGGSARANLAALARSGDRNALQEHAERLQLDGLVQRFTENTVAIGDALGMVRWWRTEQR